MEKASEFLKRGFMVNETAAMVGYDDTFTFSKVFKKTTGYSPTKYVKQNMI